MSPVVITNGLNNRARSHRLPVVVTAGLSHCDVLPVLDGPLHIWTELEVLNQFSSITPYFSSHSSPPSPLLPHLTSLTPDPFSLIPRPSTLFPNPSHLLPHPHPDGLTHPPSLLTLTPPPSPHLPYPSSLIHHPSSLIPKTSFLIPHCLPLTPPSFHLRYYYLVWGRMRDVGRKGQEMRDYGKG